MRVSVSPEQAELAPGQDIELEVTVLNDGAQVLSPVLGVTGLDPSLVSLPPAAIAVNPGEQITTVVALRIPDDAVPGEQRVALSVADPAGEQRAAGTVVLLRVGARPDIAIELQPSAVRARRTAKLDTVVRNRGETRQRLQLDGLSDGVKVTFVADEVVLEPKEEVLVRTRLRRAQRTWLREVRHGALIDVRGTGQPVSATATFTQKPLVPAWWRKLVAAIALLALYAGLVVVVSNQLLGQDEVTDAPMAGDAEEATDAPADDAGEEAEDEVFGPPVVVSGTIDGPADLTGTTVVLERIAFGDEGTLDGEGNSRIAPQTAVALPVAAVIEKIETATDEGGRFRIADGLVLGAFYRVTALRPGYEVRSVVVTIPEDGSEVEVPITLEPAAGAMSGRVVDGDGVPLGGAAVTVTDGALVFQATSATEGNVGAWSIEGLASPNIYQVIVTKEGYATATSVIELAAGQGRSDVNAQLLLGLGTIRGQVTYRGEGVGAVTIELEGEGEQRTTTTLTDGGLAGQFTFPALPMGVYQLTLSAPGWLTQTTEVVVDRGDVEVAVRDLRPGTASLSGFVHQQVAPGGGCDYPNPAVPEERENAVVRACGGVGVRVSGEAGTFATTSSTNDGSFTISGIAPGEYTVAFERYGYHAEFYEISLAAGDALTVPAPPNPTAMPASAEPAVRRVSTASSTDPALASSPVVIMRLLPSVTDDVGSITGILRDSRSPDELLRHEDQPEPPQISVAVEAGQPEPRVELGDDGFFEVDGLLPGAHEVVIRAVGYDEYRFVARVGREASADAGIITLIPFATLNLRVSDGREFAIPDTDVMVIPIDRREDAIERLNTANADPAYNVRRCFADLDEAGRHREGLESNISRIEGLCATVNSIGNVSLEQALPTGRYEVIAPVNAVDAASGIRDVADTVPLDHAPATREIDVRSGETVRQDVRLQRFPIIEGRLREPAPEAGDFQIVGDDAFGAGRRDEVLEAFPGLLPDGLGFRLRTFVNDEEVTLPPGARPRLSFGPTNGLPEGTYRIDRLAADTPGASYSYEIEIFDDNAGRARFLRFNDTAIEGLAFGETRIVNAILSPRSIDFEFRTFWERLDGTTVIEERLSLLMRGVVEYRIDGGVVDPIREEILIPANPNTGVVSTTNAFFNNDLNNPARFLEGSDLTVAFEFENDIGAWYGDPEPVIIERPILPETATVYTDTLVIAPEGREVSGQLSIPVEEDSDADLAVLNGLEVRLVPLRGPIDGTTASDEDRLPAGIITLEPANRRVSGAERTLDFTFPNVPPDRYRLEVRDPNASGRIFDFDSAPFAILPGPRAETVQISPAGIGEDDPFIIDRVVSLTVGVFERYDATWDGSATPRDYVADDIEPVDDVRVTLRRNGSATGFDIDDNGLETEAGIVTFTGLRGGDARNYTVHLSREGYYDEVVPLLDFDASTFGDPGAPSQLLTVLNAATPVPNLPSVSNARAVEIERYGEIEGFVTSLVDVATTTLGTFDEVVEDLVRNRGVVDPDSLLILGEPTDGALVEACRVDDAQCANPVASATTDDTGRFFIGVPQQSPDGTYRLRISDPDHDDIFINDIEVARGRLNRVGPLYAPYERATLTGEVTERHPSPYPLNSYVQVSVLYEGGGREDVVLLRDGSPAVMVVPLGETYRFEGLPPIGELDQRVIVEYREFGDEALSVPSSRLVQWIYETEANLKAGTTVTSNVELESEYVAISGTITGQDFEGADPPIRPVAGATVTATCLGETASPTTFTGASCLDLEGFPTPTVTTEPDGTYEFPVLPLGFYEITVTAPGYGDGAFPDQLFVRRFGDNDPPTSTVATGFGNPGTDVLLTATPIDVEVQVSSTLLPEPAGGGPLAGIDITAVYQHATASEPTAHAGNPYVVTGTSDTEGLVALILPPGDWQLETDGATAIDLDPRPHLDAVFDVEVLVASEPSLATQSFATPLDPYVALYGTVLGRDIPFADADTAPLMDAVVWPVAPPGSNDPPVYGFDATGYEPASQTTPTGRDHDRVATTTDGRWGLLVPPTPDGESAVEWNLDVEREAYDPALATLTVPSGALDIEVTASLNDDPLPPQAGVAAKAGGLPPLLNADGIVLTVAPIDVELTFRSGVWDGTQVTPTGDTVSGVTVEATWAGQPDGVDFASVAGIYALNAGPTGADGQVTLRLAPGDWEISTTGASGHVNVGIEDVYPDYPPQDLPVVAGEVNDRDIVLSKLVPTLSGTVRDDGNRALRNVEVEVFEAAASGCVAASPERLRASSGGRTGGNGTYSISDLVPERVLVRFTEFTHPNTGAETGRRAEVCVDLRAGQSSTNVDATLFVPAGGIQGEVRGIPALGASAAPLAGATVSLYSPATATEASDTQTTDEFGFYSFSELPDGVYRLEVTANGYQDEQRAVDLPADAGARVDVVLDAEPRPVRLSIESSALDGGGSLEGFAELVTLTARTDYDEQGDPASPTTQTASPATVTVDTNNSGRVFVEFEGLAPATWSVSTERASDLDQPHRDLDHVPVVITAWTGSASTVEETITINRFASVSGQVVTRTIAGGVSVPVGANVEVTLEKEGQSPTTTTTDTDGNYLFWLPDPATVTVSTELEGFEPASRTVSTVGEPGGYNENNDRDATDIDLDLIAKPRTVEVTLESDSGSLEGAQDATFTVESTFLDDQGQSFAVPVSAQSVAVAGGVATATFDSVAPATWTLTTEGLSELEEPHFDIEAEDSVEIVVPPGDGVLRPDASIVVTRYVEVTGTVYTRPLADDGVASATAESATVTVRVGGDVPEATATTSSDGTFSAWLAVPLGATPTVTTDVELAGYDPQSAAKPVPGVAPRLVDLGPILMTATPRKLEVGFTSDVGSLAGFEGAVTVLASADFGLGEPVTATADTVVSNGVATATFDSLAPATWTITTDGAVNLDEPHQELDDGEVAVSVFTGDGSAPPVPADFVLVRYPLVAGTVTPLAYEGGPELDFDSISGAVVEAQNAGGLLASDTVGTSGGNATWQLFLPAGTSGLVELSVSAENFEVATATIETGVENAAIDLIASPVEVSVTVTNATTGTVDTTIDARLLDAQNDPLEPQPAFGGPPYIVSVSTGALDPSSATVVTFRLAPGTWDLHIEQDYHITTTPPSFTVKVGQTQVLTAAITANSVLYGLVVEDRNGTLVPLDGVRVVAERDGQTYATTSGAVNDDGHNFRLRAQSGTWQISTVRNGIVRVIEDAVVIRRDGPGTEPNVLHIVLPWIEAELAGRITDGSGGAVAGAEITAVSNLGTVSVVSGEDGTYLLSGLDPDLTWAVTFAPPPGALAQPVTRFIAPGGFADAQLVLDQQLPSGYGHLDVLVEGAVPGAALEVVLEERTPFPTLNVDGRLDRTVTAAADGTASVLFEDLVPGGGTSLPADRFTVTVTGSGVTRTVSNLAVIAGLTTEVVVVMGEPPGRALDLILFDVDGPITNRTVLLERDGTVLQGTAALDSNRYRFAEVAAGTWTVQVDGYLPGTVVVGAGEGLAEATLTLSIDPDAVTDPDEGLEDPDDGLEDPDGADGGLDDPDGGLDDTGGTNGGSEGDVGGTSPDDGASSGDGTSSDGATSDDGAASEGGSSDGATSGGDTTNGGASDNGGSTDDGGGAGNGSDAGSSGDAGTADPAGSTSEPVGD